MSRTTGTSNDAPPTPGEQADTAQRRDRAQRPVPSGSATPQAAAAGSVSPATVARGTVPPPRPGGPAVDGSGNGDGRGRGNGQRRPAADGGHDQPSPTRARPADGHVGSGEVEVECPGCGLLLVGESPRPTAAWFCPKCDFPVFWASPNPEPSAPQRRARRRLPGTAGREVLGSEECWNCGERNEPGIGVCPRCAATLPKPTPPAAEQVVVEVDRLVAVPHLVRASTWPYLAAALLGGGAIAIAGTLLVLRATGALGSALGAPLSVLLGLGGGLG
jgi:hypothetical protein